MLNIFIHILCIGIGLAAEWSYSGLHGPTHWNETHPLCGTGTKQSPIDIPYAGNHAGDLTYDANLTPFTFKGYNNVNVAGLEIKNNGHTEQVDITHGSATNMSGGGLDGTYVAAQLHFHWGPDNTRGSEHTFRGRRYPLEMHIVHYKADYIDIATAVNHSDGIAVLGVFFEIDDDHMHDGQTDKMAPLVSVLHNVKYKGQHEEFKASFIDLMPETTDEYYRYQGSLTTPGCNEAVIWTVFEDKNYITSAQMAEFRKLSEDVASHAVIPLIENFRPTQNLNGRSVSKNYQNDIPSHFHWGYHGSESSAHWSEYYKTCSGTKQSPVNIPADDIVEFNADLQTLEFINYDKEITGTIKNNGHTIQIDIDNQDMSIDKGGLSGRYRAAQLHYHWGQDNSHGSEHLRNGKSYPLEVHIVHYKEEYGDIVSALDHEDGLAVVAFFFQAGFTNSKYSNLISKLTDVKFKADNTGISGISLQNLTSTSMQSPLFFRYQGGLTTPPCSQIVTWSVMMNVIHIGPEQLDEFHKIAHIGRNAASAHLHHSDYIGENNRQTQSLGTRKVYTSYEFLTDTSRASVLQQGVAICVLMLSGLILFM